MRAKRMTEPCSTSYWSRKKYWRHLNVITEKWASYRKHVPSFPQHPAALSQHRRFIYNDDRVMTKTAYSFSLYYKILRLTFVCNQKFPVIKYGILQKMYPKKSIFRHQTRLDATANSSRSVQQEHQINFVWFPKADGDRLVSTGPLPKSF